MMSVAGVSFTSTHIGKQLENQYVIERIPLMRAHAICYVELDPIHSCVINHIDAGS